MAIVEVAIAVPLPKTFDYQSESALTPGVRVKVPFGRKQVIGMVLGNKDSSEFSKLKAVQDIVTGDRQSGLCGAVIPKSKHAEHQLKDGDKIEIIKAVGGG